MPLLRAFVAGILGLLMMTGEASQISAAPAEGTAQGPSVGLQQAFPILNDRCIRPPPERWRGYLADGSRLSMEELEEMLALNREWVLRRGQSGEPAELQGADIELLTLSGRPLFGIDFSEARLGCADLSRSNLTGATMEGTYLRRADLSRALLNGVEGRGALLIEANLRDARMEGADFDEAHLPGADLGSARIRRAGLARADLRDARMEGADVRESNLAGADLRGSSLRGAVLVATDLSRASLGRADLSSVALREVDLTDADLRGARLHGVVWEPTPGSLPRLASLTTARGLTALRYTDSPHGLLELRSALREAGFRAESRAVTAALRRADRAEREEAGGLAAAGAWLERALFDWTVRYGHEPARALLILAGLIPLFALLYLPAVGPGGGSAGGGGRGAAADSGRVRGLAARAVRWTEQLGRALALSLVSATRLGPPDRPGASPLTWLAPGDGPRPPRGWARTASGVQGLVSLYLLALALLSFVWHPFG